MRYRLMATYLGVPYHAGLGPDGTDVTLFSPGPPPEDLGFTAAAGHWRKQVSVLDLSALWQSRLVGEYGGEPCLVLDDLGERLHIAYLGRDAVRARQLGYWEIDREVFEVAVARDEVADLAEERVEFPLASATFPPSSPGRRSPPPAGGPLPGTDPLSGTGPLPRVFSPAGAFPPPGPPPGPEPEPDTLIYGRLDSQGRLVSRAHTEPAGPRPLMGPAGSQAPVPPGKGPSGKVPRVPAGPAGNPGPDRGPRTTDRAAAWHGSPASEPWPAPRSAPEPRPEPPPQVRPEPRVRPEPHPEPRVRPESENAPSPGRRTARRDRVSPQSVFAELLSLAGIPQTAYAVDDEVAGAMCLVKADGGFEVFSCTQDARLEVHFFEDEEAAYFYLFGVLAAEAIHSRRLGPTRSNEPVNGSREAGDGTVIASAREDVSKYLRSENLPTSPSHPAMVN
jgi:hypothetical protein